MSRIDTLEPAFKAKVVELIALLKDQGINCVVTSGRRTIAEQNKLYAQGRSAPGKIVTKAKGGQSAHNFGLAVDLCPTKPDGTLNWNAIDDDWQVMAITGKTLGLTCGYYFKSIVDKPHFEDPSWKEAQAMWRAGKLEVA